LKEDVTIRNAIRSRLRDAEISRIEIERSTNQVTVTIHTAKPGVVIGKGGAKVEELRQVLGKTTGKAVKVNIFEIRFPEVDPRLIAENVAQQLERRVSFRKVLKQTVQRSMKAGAKGVKVAVAGRLGGAEMSRREWEREGRVPLHTLRADIEFGIAIAKTTFGTIGVKAWVYRGDIEPAPRVVAGGPTPAPIQRPIPPTPPNAMTGALGTTITPTPVGVGAAPAAPVAPAPTAPPAPTPAGTPGTGTS
jgi:small subunit ribosomal protein S3